MTPGEKFKHLAITKNLVKEYEVSQLLFSKVLCFDFSGLVDDKSITTKILNFKKNFPKSRISSIMAWHSDFDLHQKIPELNRELFDVVTNKIVDHIIVSRKSQYIPILTASWAAVYNKGSFTNSHNHGMYSHFSGVYYAQVDKNSAGLNFDGDNLTIKPETNMCVLFPSHLYHSVPIHTTDTERVVIAFNYQFNTSVI